MKTFLFLLVAAVTFTAPSARAAEYDDYVKEIATCEAILQEFMADPAYAIPQQVWQRARAVVIVNQFKAGFIFGMKGGWGVILAKRADGSWSIPVMLRAGEASLGLQIGGAKEETVYILTSDETVKMLYQARFNVGVDAKAVAGPRFSEVETVSKEILESPVLVYTKSKGLFAGATVKTGYISRNDDANRRFYNTYYTLPELLYGNFVEPNEDVTPIMNLVKSYAP